MPRYYAYNKKTGAVVHVHETYDATSGTSLRCTKEEVLDLVNETIAKDDLEILEVQSENQPAVGVVRVNPATRTLELEAEKKK